MCSETPFPQSSPMPDPVTSRTVTRDRAVRAVHLLSGVLTVAAMGATGAITGALEPPDKAAPAVEQQAASTPTPSSRRAVHAQARRSPAKVTVPAPAKGTASATRKPAVRNALVQQAPVVTSGAS
jgi:cytoskeletal protein RodZ